MPEQLPDRTEELATLHAEIFGSEESPTTNKYRPAVDLDVAEIIAKAKAARNGPKFSKLFNGDSSGYSSASEADLALVSLITFYTQDPQKIDGVFRQSGRYREKWERADYRERTIAAALALDAETYTSLAWVSGNENGRKPPPHNYGASVGAEVQQQPQEPLWEPSVLLFQHELPDIARNTFIDDYTAYASQRTDAPRSFHASLAVAALSVIVGRRAVLRLTNGEIYPSIWILILADSTLFRKSTAMDLQRDVVEAVAQELLTPNDFTPQRFVAILAEHDGLPLLFVRDEFAGFYDALNRLDFMAGLKETLCNVYDGRPFRREKMRPKRKDEEAEPKDSDWRYNIREPFLAMAVATTEERFSEVARVNDVHSGFLPRFAFVLPSDEIRPRQPVGDLTGEVVAARDRLIQHLREVADNEIHLTCDPSALQRFNQYSEDIEIEAKGAPDRNLVAIVGSRVAWMALRVAMVLAVSDGTQRVSVPHVLRGIEMAEGWRHAALKLLSQLAPSKAERRAARVVQLVERAGPRGIKRREVMRAIKISKREMDELEQTLAEREEIRVERRNTEGGLSIWYFAPKAVTVVTPVT